MIEKIKTITYEVRSHRHCTTLSENGKIISIRWPKAYPLMFVDSDVKALIWHLRDVLKCMRRIEREKAK